MASTSVNVANVGINITRAEEVVLTAHPDMGIIKVSFLAPLFVIAAGAIAYLLPMAIDPYMQTGLSGFVAIIGLGGTFFLLAVYEALSRAVYTMTTEYIEEEYGIIYKRLRRIPLSYVRDVTQTQNFLQAMFHVSSITVSPTNGDKIVLSNILDGKEARETIWSLVLRTVPSQ